MATVIGRDHLSVVGPFGRAFAKCAGCDRLVHEKTKFGGFCCITCTMRHFDIGNPVGEHGHRCEDRLANDVDPDAYRDLDGNPVSLLHSSLNRFCHAKQLVVKVVKRFKTSSKKLV